MSAGLHISEIGALVGDPGRANMCPHCSMVVANGADAAEPRRRATPRIDPSLRRARTCYDHLAGQLGVGIADRMVAQGIVVLGDEAGELTGSGRAWLEGFGITAEPIGRTRRLFCRPCLDWSERRPHLAGRLGAALCQRCGELGWIERKRDSRAVTITPTGLRGFAEVFGLSLA
jgi:hypothetical protein